MKRRTFIANAVAGIVGIAHVDRFAAAQTPCAPQFTGPGTVPNRLCGVGGTSLADVAASLSAGQSSEFTKNTLQRQNDIQWSLRTIWHDPVRRELQYMGKPATSQSENYSHYIYREDTNEWTTSGQSLFPGLGHVWDCTFDTVNGDYWFHKYGENKLRWFDRSEGASGSWKSTVDQTSPALTAGSAPIFAAMGWHPNLFGSGDPGVLIWATFRFFAYSPRSGQFSVLNPSNFDSGSEYFARSRGQAVYLPDTDELVCFSRNTGNGHRAIVVKAGAGNSDDVFRDRLVSLAGTPPLAVDGAGGDTNHGHVTPHPTDPGRLILLEEKGSSRVWESLDQAETWQLQGFRHPFQDLPNSSPGEYTVGTISEYGVIIGMSSDSEGGGTVIWKPGTS